MYQVRPVRLFALLLALCATTSACAQPRADEPTLLQDLRVLSADEMEGRQAGTAGGARARAYLLERLVEAGVRPLPEQPFEYPFNLVASARSSARGVNVLGYVEGTRYPDRYLIVSAHYDHEGIRDGQVQNGADDNASGVAALLALAEHFARERPDHSILFALFDAEEDGLQGSRAFIANPPVPLDSVVLNVNMDMVGRGDNNELYAAGTYHHPWLRPVLARAAEGSSVTLRFGHDKPDGSAGDDWTRASDHGSFYEAGIPFVYFGVEDHPDYHRPTDDWERIPVPFFIGAVALMQDALRALDASIDERTPSPAD